MAWQRKEGFDGVAWGSDRYVRVRASPCADGQIVEDWRGNAYRAVYTVRFAAAVFVVHVFQKKAKSGVATPKQDIELIRERLKVAEQIVKELSR